MTANPATVTVAERGVVYAVALKTAVPLPLPGDPLASVSHDALLEAVQVHPLAAVTGNEIWKPAPCGIAVAMPTA